MQQNERALTLRMPADLHDALQRQAAQEERTLTGLLRHLARTYIGETASEVELR